MLMSTDYQSVVSRWCENRVFIPSLLLLAFAVIGCSSHTKGLARLAIQGEVTLNGEPLAAGIIKFIPTGTSQGPVAALPIKDGYYKCRPSEGPIFGVYRVEIEAGLNEDLAEIAANPKLFVEHLKTNRKPVPELRVPSKYNRDSILTAEIKRGSEREFDFDLEAATPELTQQ